jgi:UDP-N-acetylglucosamine 2-epimerase (hydrolysing)
MKIKIAVCIPAFSNAENIKNCIDSVVKSNNNFIVILPNNDPGNEIIINAYKKINSNIKFKIIKSMRFEYFLTLLKNCDVVIGNSSCGVIEAPFYGIQTINLGNRQNNRSKEKSIINIGFAEKKILNNLKKYLGKKYKKSGLYGNGNADTKIIKILKNKRIWLTKTQKTLSD